MNVSWFIVWKIFHRMYFNKKPDIIKCRVYVCYFFIYPLQSRLSFVLSYPLSGYGCGILFPPRNKKLKVNMASEMSTVLSSFVSEASLHFISPLQLKRNLRVLILSDISITLSVLEFSLIKGIFYFCLYSFSWDSHLFLPHEERGERVEVLLKQKYTF